MCSVGQYHFMYYIHVSNLDSLKKYLVIITIHKLGSTRALLRIQPASLPTVAQLNLIVLYIAIFLVWGYKIANEQGGDHRIVTAAVNYREQQWYVHKLAYNNNKI